LASSIIFARSISPIFSITTGTGRKATTSILGNFTLDDGAFAYDSATGTVSIDALNTGPMAFSTDAGILSWIDLPTSTTTAGIVNSYSAQIGGTPVLTIYGTTTSAGTINYGSVGIGTTSPWRTLSVNGSVAFNGLTTSASSTSNSNLCVNAGGEVTRSTVFVGCIGSSERFKHDISHHD
ncbi:MAG: hypothetical protein AAB538_02060, partial [Patescibacteria group bacterium]